MSTPLTANDLDLLVVVLDEGTAADVLDGSSTISFELICSPVIGSVVGAMPVSANEVASFPPPPPPCSKGQQGLGAS